MYEHNVNWWKGRHQLQVQWNFDIAFGTFAQFVSLKYPNHYEGHKEARVSVQKLFDLGLHSICHVCQLMC